MLVGGIVIHDQVQGQFRGRLPVQVFEELQPLAVGVLRSGAGQHLARQVVQGGKERHRAVAVVVVGFGTQVALAQRQPRLAALEGLDLRLFIAA